MEPQEIVFCKGGGCTAKLGPGILARVLNNLPKTYDPNLLIGFDGSDDAAVYKLTDDLAIVQTLDFFPPMVEDPYIFGQIAAANALSDIYAMGGDVKTALNIVCFPEAMDLNILGKIMLGGSEKVREAGGVLAGGHSIADSDVKYGLSVTGVIHPDKVFANSGCKVGDALILTKPLGVGIVCTASRMKAASKEAYDLAVKSMTTLNKYASEILRKYRLHGCTDVTGFGFLGHLCEMVTDQATARIYKDKVPYIPECEDYVEEFYLTAAAQRNRNHVQDKVEFRNCSFATEEILYDPQTSGGLLASVDKEDVPAIMEELEKASAIYQQSQNKENFSMMRIEQNVYPTAANDRLIFFQTSLHLPLAEKTFTERNLCEVFDRKTGAYIPIEDLFICPLEELGSQLLALAHLSDADRADMEAAFRREYIFFTEDSLCIDFPAGSLTNYKEQYIVPLKYTSDLRGLMHDWAIPKEG